MVECYIGEIRMFAGTYAPDGWALCNGQLLSISQYEALFSLIVTAYGGDGVSTFALPDMRGRIPIGMGNSRSGSNYPLGSAAGTETVTLLNTQMPVHSHAPNAQSEGGNITAPTNGFWAQTAVTSYEVPGAAGLSPMSVQAIGAAGGSQPHENMMPYMTLSFIISTVGIYPSTN